MNDYIEMTKGNLGRVIVVRLRPGADVLLSLEEACKENHITNGVILSAIGSIQSPQFCDVVELPTKAGYGYGETLHLTGPIELTSASGVVCHDDAGEINLHVHVDLCDRHGNAHGGHLAEGTKVLMTLDAVIAEVEGIDMRRKYNDELGIPLLAPRQL